MNITSSSLVTPIRPLPARRERALVLHGGGSSGNAWEIGVLAGLAEGGLDVTGADLVVGTSAGATAAVQITSAPPAGLLAAILEAPPARPGTTPQGRRAHRPARHRPPGADRRASSPRRRDAADMRRRMGAGALELDAGPEHPSAGGRSSPHGCPCRSGRTARS